MDYEYEEQLDNSNVICPYCKYEYQEEAENYSEDSRAVACEECGKKFYIRQSYSVDHYAMPDCELNDSHHKWKTITLTHGRIHDFCSVCSKCR